VRRWIGIQALRRGLLFQLAFAACMLLELSDAADLLLFHHGICAEHGEAVHLSRQHGLFARAEATVLGGRGKVAAARSGSSDNEDHEHCPFFTSRADRTGVAPAASHKTVGATVTATAPPDLCVPGLSPSALRLRAPKTSPPV